MCFERRVTDISLQVIDYKQAKVVDSALFSHYAPYALVLDCVGGKEVVEHIDHLLLDDPKAPHLGIYVTIVGDSTFAQALLLYCHCASARVVSAPRYGGYALI